MGHPKDIAPTLNKKRRGGVQQPRRKKLMRIFLVLICSLALACVAGAQEEKKPNKQAPKKKPAQAGQVSQPPGHAAGKPTTTGKPATTGKPTGVGKAKATGKPAEVGKATGAGKAKPTAKPAEVGKAAGAGKAKPTAKPTEVGKAAGAGKVKATAKPTEISKPAEVGKAAGAAKGTTAGKAIKPQHFKLANKPKPEVAPPVKFQQSKRIAGAQNWTGPRYAVFRNYSSQWHDRNWWRGHSNRVVFVFGGWYAWNAGYWYPAWGYDPNAYYPYDGPIYAYNNLPPDQVTANVQATLQQQGYYHGEVDGLLGPLTRAAIADYQRANGLAETAAIDQPTLERLGMA
jgi:hypothetical protein